LVANPSVAVPASPGVVSADGTSHPNTPPSTPTPSAVPVGGSGLDTVLNGLSPAQEAELEAAITQGTALPAWFQQRQQAAPPTPVAPVTTSTLPKPEVEKSPTLRVHTQGRSDVDFVDAVRTLQQQQNVTFEEATRQVLAQRSPQSPTATPPADPVLPVAPVVPDLALPDGFTLPTSLAETQRMVTDYKVRAGNYDYGDLTAEQFAAVETALQSHMAGLAAIASIEARNQQQDERQQEAAAFAAAWQPYSDQATALYPALSDPSSPLSQEFVRIQEMALANADPFALNPASAVSYAHQAAVALGQRSVQPAPVQSPSVFSPQPPAARLPMSIPAILSGSPQGSSTMTAPPPPPTMEQIEADADRWIRQQRARKTGQRVH